MLILIFFLFSLSLLNGCGVFISATRDWLTDFGGLTAIGKNTHRHRQSSGERMVGTGGHLPPIAFNSRQFFLGGIYLPPPQPPSTTVTATVRRLSVSFIFNFANALPPVHTKPSNKVIYICPKVRQNGIISIFIEQMTSNTI